uniref:reticulon-like protein B10 n=1 Tax=Erigeron canadensis TaxID=72917 RepID=UPI001CB98815|nr:reticulon-like protein B10 [Erigeron canadensis]
MSETSVYNALGGGAVADTLLWRKCYSGVILLIGSTLMWVLFEKAGYNFLAFLTNASLLLAFILFFWAKSASLLNRPLPPIPDLDISEETVIAVADEARVWVNSALATLHEIAVDGNLKTLFSAMFGLWLISYIGSFFNFLTLIYIGVLLSLSVPFLYERFQSQVDEKLIVVHKNMSIVFKKVDLILQKISMSQKKQKKTE